MDTLANLFEFLEKNQNIASAVSATASALAAIIAVLVSIYAVRVSAKSAEQQQRHNTLTVKPIPEVTVTDYENSLQVKLRNHGSGPLLIRAFSATFHGRSCKSLIECMPDIGGRHWTNFSGVIDGRALLPGKEIVLIELTASQGETSFNISRDHARLALSETEIVVEYSDIYDSIFLPYKKSLSWFGRNLE
ncbi:MULTISPECIES: hypothetical protein [unclassified Pseudomonas]|uniref:hypothetical protein n=1 Tax=unclassified Pseudomonas TaxID=196821 RepID=UPI002A370B67|nr:MULTISPECIES: hypothetical protein [unclassified Pseudomonas]MDX9672271.1 hypothetical protein [Pseudomonas sp. P8_250]WPN33777.1 hypothetical protein QMK53_16335 [Pseudomonas sp. P8_139]WPN39037.1 hypothetical protein QMK55_15040 [Pseudomonas sp. P8_229]